MERKLIFGKHYPEIQFQYAEIAEKCENLKIFCICSQKLNNRKIPWMKNCRATCNGFLQLLQWFANSTWKQKLRYLKTPYTPVRRTVWFCTPNAL